LTNFEKRLTLKGYKEENSMPKSKLEILGLSLCLAVVFAACGGPAYQRNQLKFGIEAAQHELWHEAIFRWEKVIAADPGSAAAYNNLAVAYEKLGRFEEAEKAYQRALALDPEHEHIQANFKRFQENLNQIEEEQTDPEREKKEKKDEKIKK
jgi:Tfp pilus assembly protein PilF